MPRRLKSFLGGTNVEVLCYRNDNHSRQRCAGGRKSSSAGRRPGPVPDP